MKKRIRSINVASQMNNQERDAIFDKITEHLLRDEKPSLYIEETARQELWKEYPLSLLLRLQNTEQSPKYHPEGTAWNHTMMVLDEAAKVRNQSSDPEVLLWSALLHDIGKPSTTVNRKGKITSYDHDKAGETLCIEFLQYFNRNSDFIEAVAALVRYHMHMLYVLQKLPYADMKGLRKRTKVTELALLCLCDRLGRTGADREAEYKEYREFLKRLE